jgi:hypothetical protein
VWLERLLPAACDCYHLSDWEMSFALDMRERFKKYRASMRVSDKQRAILQRLESRLRKLGQLP